MSVSQDTTYPSGAANTGDMNDAIPMRGLNPPAPRAEIFRGQPVTSSQELDTEDTRSSSSDPRNVRLWRLVEQFELENQIVYPDPEDKAVVANLATLQRIILCDLRDQLIQEIGAIKNNMFASQPFGPGWRSQTTSTGAKKPDSSGEENAKRLKNIKPLMKEYGRHDPKIALFCRHSIAYMQLSKIAHLSSPGDSRLGSNGRACCEGRQNPLAGPLSSQLR